MPLPFDLAVGQWWQVPRVGNSQLADVYATPAPAGAQTAIMDTWGSMSVDTLRKQLFVWNGGHTDYAGNEGYAFGIDPNDPSTYLLWRRKVYYSTADTDDSETYSDGSPASRHIYGSLEYHPGLDKHFFGPGGAIYDAGTFTRGVWALNASIESPSAASPSSWTRYDDLDAGIDEATACNMAYDKLTAKFFHNHHGTNGGLATFDPTQAAASQWVVVTNGSDNGSVQFDPCCIAYTSPKRVCYHSNNLGKLTVRRLDTNAWEGSESDFGATGATNIFSLGNSVGIQYDALLGELVCWGGLVTGGTDTRDVYRVNLGTKVVTRVAGSGDTPDAPATNGTFGRWRNLSDCGAAYSGLYALVNRTTGHMYFYRASGSPPPPIMGQACL